MGIPASKTQVDKLGDRLRGSRINDEDLKALDDYRHSFSDAYSHVTGMIRERLHLAPTGRPAKSTSSIIQKLLRESIRLSQIQDIAGCRIVVPDTAAQETAVSALRDLFSKSTTIDRRLKPSFGYRAVHVIVSVSKKLVEIQVRTEMQHSWAEFSEKLSDVVAQDVKYGGGPDNVRNGLAALSRRIGEIEGLEVRLTELSEHRGNPKLEKIRQEISDLRKTMVSDIQEMTRGLPGKKR